MALEPSSSRVLRGTVMIGGATVVTAVVRMPGMHRTCMDTVVAMHTLRHRRSERHYHHLEDDEEGGQTSHGPAVHGRDARSTGPFGQSGSCGSA
jgi:hypothetical protein